MKSFTIAILHLIFTQLIFGQIDSTIFQSPEKLTARMLELISGEIDEVRKWDEYRNLFLPTAQKISINRNAPKNRQVRVMNLEEFVRNVGPLYKKNGFEEIVIGLTINEFNGIANVFQSFYCKNLIGTYEKRGINSYQLIYVDDRWWIASTTFTNESEENKIPEKYLYDK